LLKLVLLFVAGLALAAPGGAALYDLQHRPPVELGCAEYVQSRPQATWIRLRNCELDYLRAGYRERNGTIEELLFPVHPAGADPSGPAPLVAVTRDPAALAIAQRGIGAGRQLDQQQFLIMMLKIVTALGASRDVEGTIRTGFMERFRTRRALAGLAAPLLPDAGVMDLHAQPGAFAPVMRLTAGAALIGAVAALAWRRSAGRSVRRASLRAARSPAPGADVRVRGLLLLNLGPDDGRHAIEYAPPLGSRDDVVRQISAAIPGLQFDARGRGVRRTSDGAVIVAIGTADPVASAIAGADGASGADAIGRLMVETGWRAYVPVAGCFAAPDDLTPAMVPRAAARAATAAARSSPALPASRDRDQRRPVEAAAVGQAARETSDGIVHR
jgi:hypothetical protein